MCALVCTHGFTYALPHTVNKTSNVTWVKYRHQSRGKKYFTLSDQPGDILRGCWRLSLPILIFPTTHYSLPRGFVNTPDPSGRRAPLLAFTWFGCSPQKLRLALGPRAEPPLLRARPPLLCPPLWPGSAQRSGKRSGSIKTFDISFYEYLHSGQGSRVRKLH